MKNSRQKTIQWIHWGQGSSTIPPRPDLSAIILLSTCQTPSAPQALPPCPVTPPKPSPLPNPVTYPATTTKRCHPLYHPHQSPAKPCPLPCPPGQTLPPGFPIGRSRGLPRWLCVYSRPRPRCKASCLTRPAAPEPTGLPRGKGGRRAQGEGDGAALTGPGAAGLPRRHGPNRRSGGSWRRRGGRNAAPPRPNGSGVRCQNGDGPLRQPGMTGDVVLLPARPGIASGVVAGNGRSAS